MSARRFTGNLQPNGYGETMRTVKQILEYAGYETQAYSGRCMYGEECLAIVTDDEVRDIFAAVLEVVEQEAECHRMAKAFRGMREDNLGKHIVIYFPGIAPDGHQ